MIPEVSIIIPCFNRGYLIKDTLNSVLNQSFTNWECIIVDDQSEDNTQQVILDFIQNDTRFKFYVRPSTRLKGANACRNIGFEKSSGKYINWLDSDDVFDSKHIETHIKKHKQDDKIAATITNSLLFYEYPGDSNHNWSNINVSGDLLTNLISLNSSWQTGAVVWNRICVPEKAPFNECLTSSQEWTFHIEQVINGLTYAFIEDNTVYIRRHENRIGKDMSPKKFKCSFLSRYIIYHKLLKENLLDQVKGKYLIKKMIQSTKGAAELNYDEVIMFSVLRYINLLRVSQYRRKILTVVFVGLPLKRFCNKGERFFKF